MLVPASSDGTISADELTITTPCAGTVLRLAINAPGAVVQDGEMLAEVACAGEQLQAEVSVTPTGTGRIEPGQPVRLLYDAFPYQRYGIKHGTVRWVRGEHRHEPGGRS